MSTARDAFFNKIYELIDSGEDIIVITSDLGAPSLDDLRKNYPERYISVGIAEQSLVSIASGLAYERRKVIAYGLNPFPITRAFDQVRCLMADKKVPITLCGLNAGICSAESGYSHMPIEDYGMMRMLNNVVTYNPSDTSMAEELALQTLDNDVPRYIRFDKCIRERIYNGDINYSAGFNVLGNKESKKVVVSQGCFIKELLDINNSQLKIIDVFSNRICEEELISVITDAEVIVSLEENVRNGGLGSSILEICSDYNLSVPIKRIGFDSKKGYYHVLTNREYIRKDMKISIDALLELIK